MTKLPGGLVGVGFHHSGFVRIYNSTTGISLHTLLHGDDSDGTGQDRRVCCIVDAGDGRMLSGGKNGNLQIWDIETGVCMQELVVGFGQNPQDRSVSNVIRLRDGRIVSAAGGKLDIWN